jgi:tetratricopeptide (TPR) repeat protein
LGPSPFYLAGLALESANVRLHERSIDLASLGSYVSQNKIKRNEGPLKRYLSEILLNADDGHLDEAEDWIKKAVETDERYGMRFNLGQDYASYAELMRQKGDQPKAKEKLDKAIEIFNECGADGWVEKYEKELSAL